jgi:hypothetical protein
MLHLEATTMIRQKAEQGEPDFTKQLNKIIIMATQKPVQPAQHGGHIPIDGWGTPTQVLKVKKTQKPMESQPALMVKKTQKPKITGTLTKVMKDSKTGRTTSTTTTPYKQTPISEKEFNK